MDENENERMVLFSDAVIAITITLLVLELRLPEAPEAMDDAQLWAAIVAMLPHLFAYMLSFVVIATFWIGHRRSFTHIKRSNGTLIWLNMAFLMVLGLMPFVTGVLAETSGAVGTSLYAGTIAVVSLLLGTMTVYADRAGLVDAGEYRRPAWLGYLNAVVFGLSIPLAFYNSDLAKYFWLLLIPLGIWSGRLRRAG